MKLLDIPFEHLDLNAYTDKEEVRRYSPMGKVPALVLNNGEVLIDSAGIIDVLHERVGPEKALIPPSGPARLKALQLVGIGINIYPKLSSLYDETLRPKEHQLQSAFEGLRRTSDHRVKIARSTDRRRLVCERHARPGRHHGRGLISGVCGLILPDHVNAKNFPRLAALSERAMKIDAFVSTVPQL